MEDERPLRALHFTAAGSAFFLGLVVILLYRHRRADFLFDDGNPPHAAFVPNLSLGTPSRWRCNRARDGEGIHLAVQIAAVSPARAVG